MENKKEFNVIFKECWLDRTNIFTTNTRNYNKTRLFLKKWFGIYCKYGMEVLDDPKPVVNGWEYSMRHVETTYYFLWIRYKTRIARYGKR
jgi:hypothetical protein